MLILKKILFPTDFSRCANQALAHAVNLARRYQAELHALHVVVLPEGDPRSVVHTEQYNARLMEMANQQMAADLKGHRTDEVKLQQSYQRGISTAPEILQYAKENDFDLIVMGTHGRRGLGHLFLGSVAEEVVRMARCSVLTIRERKEPMPVETLARILVPVDFSDHSNKALAYAKELAAGYQARLQLLHVVEKVRFPQFYMSERISYFDLVPDVEAKSRQALQEFLRTAAGPEVAAAPYVVTGLAAYEIAKFAEHQSSDLIVIATHGLTGLERVLHGSVTEKVVRMAPCPVFTVSTFGKSLL